MEKPGNVKNVIFPPVSSSLSAKPMKGKPATISLQPFDLGKQSDYRTTLTKSQ